MSDSGIVRFWGSEKLRTWSKRSLADVELPESSRSFLTRVGLPCDEDWALRWEAGTEPLPRLPQKASYRRIGFDDVVPICLDEARNGAVISVDPYAPVGERYVNRLVEDFVSFLTLYQSYRNAAGGCSEEGAQEIIDKVERAMKDIDPSAFADPENWWPVMIEQMREGLL